MLYEVITIVGFTFLEETGSLGWLSVCLGSQGGESTSLSGGSEVEGVPRFRQHLQRSSEVAATILSNAEAEPGPVVLDRWAFIGLYLRGVPAGSYNFV